MSKYRLDSDGYCMGAVSSMTHCSHFNVKFLAMGITACIFIFSSTWHSKESNAEAKLYFLLCLKLRVPISLCL